MLFKSSDILKKYAQITGSINLLSYKQTLIAVETQHLLPILGKELYNSLVDVYKNASTETISDNNLNELLEKSRAAVAPLFVYYFAAKADVQLSDSGMQRSDGTNLKTAYQEQRTEFRQANLTEGYSAIELLLEFLEENKASYPTWVDSSSFKKYRSLFIKTGKEFDEYFPSHSPYRNYWAMRSKMMDIEENIIRSFLGDEIFDDLKEKDSTADGVLSDLDKKLLPILKKAIANYTIAQSIPFLNVQISSNGITVVNSNRTTNDETTVRNNADDKALNNLIKSCELTAQSYIENAKKFLTKNKTEFSTWVGFLKPNTDDDFDINEGNQGLFGMG